MRKIKIVPIIILLNFVVIGLLAFNIVRVNKQVLAKQSEYDNLEKVIETLMVVEKGYITSEYDINLINENSLYFTEKSAEDLKKITGQDYPNRIYLDELAIFDEIIDTENTTETYEGMQFDSVRNNYFIEPNPENYNLENHQVTIKSNNSEFPDLELVVLAYLDDDLSENQFVPTNIVNKDGYINVELKEIDTENRVFYNIFFQEDGKVYRLERGVV